MTRDLSPITRTITVPWNQQTAYERFTAGFGSWWPRYGHSIGGPRVVRVAFECRPGGRIYEAHRDGTQYEWGTVTALEPPARVAFIFHASYAKTDAQTVDVTFVADGPRTRVTLVSSGWETMSPQARRTRGGYSMGWTAILARYASRFNAGELFFVAMSAGLDLTGGRKSFMRNSIGRIPADGSAS